MTNQASRFYPFHSIKPKHAKYSYMKFRLLPLLFLLACTPPAPPAVTPLPAKEDTTPPAKNDIPKVLIGETIDGDFNGDGISESATVVLTKKGEGNPVEDGTPDEYQVQFNNPVMEPLVAGCCEMRLVNEGDLNGDGTDEISLFQAPLNGCSYMMRTYSFKAGNWHQTIEPFLVPTGCDPPADPAVQARVFREGGTIYFLDTDMEEEGMPLVKKKAVLKK